ncbi:hypothetical protein ACNFR4_17205, partial [Streptomyces sp. CPS1]
MVTYAQAQERAEEWINGDVPVYQHREVRVREFELGFVVWGEDRAEGPRSDAGSQRLVIARDSGEATLWPALPVGEVIRRYEEEYGGPDGPRDAVPAPAPARVDLNQTSFLLTPPEWLQEAADKLGIGERRPEGAAASDSGDRAGSGDSGGAADSVGSPGGSAPAGVPVPEGATPWAGTDTNGGAGEDDDRSVPLPATVFAPPLGDADDGAPRPPAVAPDAKTALMAGGSQLPRTALAPALDTSNAPDAQGGSGVPRGNTPSAPGGVPMPPPPGGPQGVAPTPPPVAGVPQGSTPPPPPAPGGVPMPPPVPGGPQGSVPPAPPVPGAPVYGYPAPVAPGAPAPGGVPAPGAP